MHFQDKSVPLQIASVRACIREGFGEPYCLSGCSSRLGSGENFKMNELCTVSMHVQLHLGEYSNAVTQLGS